MILGFDKKRKDTIIIIMEGKNWHETKWRYGYIFKKKGLYYAK